MQHSFSPNVSGVSTGQEALVKSGCCIRVRAGVSIMVRIMARISNKVRGMVTLIINSLIKFVWRTVSVGNLPNLRFVGVYQSPDKIGQ